MNANIPVITLDGPSGAGKGTISRIIAKRLGWHYLDSGAIYRALAVETINLGISADDEVSVRTAAREMDLRFEFEAQFAVLLSGRDISAGLQSEACGNQASRIAAIASVREVLLQKQRDFRRLPGLVADGRDMGTVVFPDAPFKFFLTASAKVRGERRYKQLKEKGMNVNLDKIIDELLRRDQRDQNRKAAPLVRAEDAIPVDSSRITIDQVVERITNLILAD